MALFPSLSRSLLLLLRLFPFPAFSWSTIYVVRGAWCAGAQVLTPPLRSLNAVMHPSTFARVPQPLTNTSAKVVGEQYRLVRDTVLYSTHVTHAPRLDDRAHETSRPEQIQHTATLPSPIPWLRLLRTNTFVRHYNVPISFHADLVHQFCDCRPIRLASGHVSWVSRSTNRHASV